MITEKLAQEKIPSPAPGKSGARRPRIGGVALGSALVLAPMAGITDRPMRMLCREMGAALAITEMVSAEGLIRRKPATLDLARGYAGEEPLWVQLFGSSARSMAEAAKIARELGAHGVDINLGCPVPKVVKAGAGASLMREPGAVKEILRAVRGAVSVPVTVKMRAGFDAGSVNFMEVARICQGEGADALTLHPRTARHGFRHPADWPLIARLKEEVLIPVIGNGDVKTPEDAQRMLRETGCDAVMVGRAARGAPWIFRQMLVYLETGDTPGQPEMEERLELIARHVGMLEEEYGPKNGLTKARMHLNWYVRGLRGAAVFRRKASGAREMGELMDLVGDFFTGKLEDEG